MAFSETKKQHLEYISLKTPLEKCCYSVRRPDPFHGSFMGETKGAYKLFLNKRRIHDTHDP